MIYVFYRFQFRLRGKCCSTFFTRQRVSIINSFISISQLYFPLALVPTSLSFSWLRSFYTFNQMLLSCYACSRTLTVDSLSEIILSLIRFYMYGLSIISFKIFLAYLIIILIYFSLTWLNWFNKHIGLCSHRFIEIFLAITHWLFVFKWYNILGTEGELIFITYFRNLLFNIQVRDTFPWIVQKIFFRYWVLLNCYVVILYIICINYFVFLF